MKWHTVDTKSELDKFDQQICWEDSESIEYYATIRNEDYFPPDISRSGYVNKNIHVLCRICGHPSPYLEMVWIDCDWFLSHFVNHPYMSGRVDSLKRVEIQDYEGQIQMRCSRLIYRFLDGEISEGGYFQRQNTQISFDS